MGEVYHLSAWAADAARAALPRAARLWAGLSLAAVLLSPLWAQAQEKGFDVQAFRPYGGPLDLARVAQSRPVVHGSLVGGLYLHHMVDPLVLVRKGAQGKSVSLVGNRLQVWVDYQLRHMERYKSFRFEVDTEWKRMYDSILANKPAGSDFELKILKVGKYEKNTALMMPPPKSGIEGFIPDSVKGNPPELVWGRPYDFVEAKAWKDLPLTGNLEAMIRYVEEYGGHLELWIRSAKHVDGATQLSGPLKSRLKQLEAQGRARVMYYPP